MEKKKFYNEKYCQRRKRGKGRMHLRVILEIAAKSRQSPKKQDRRKKENVSKKQEKRSGNATRR